ncbi:hypothetical protein FM042_09360 [Aliidiomarina halalkaliphila]|uniref:Fis family transcriptional regulator n=1 Tax=Aliidiomarina halalkaliphila TaxID=2593535 RepID=A0A552X0B6_9GAMM|nr:hypothetical protein [Aliidiomarina halalkaliphila]TRW48375.1 hypothetical protein FM042_09360 [Aliidiomarina halalkaliphila]
MRKTDKKRDNQIIQALTEVCEASKFDVDGFVWLTHAVNYQRFPESLTITLAFAESTPEKLLLEGLETLVPRIQLALEPIVGQQLPARQIEACYEHKLH